MTRDTSNLPTARSWRDIPQPVVPRAMSREGRWRLTMSGVKVIVLVLILGAMGWGAWLVSTSMHRNVVGTSTPPMKPAELATDGVLDAAWLERTLALPPKATLLELDLTKLCSQILANDQVMTAQLTRRLPDRLVVKITERNPVARVMTEWKGKQQAFLVARDGMLYQGTNYHPDLLAQLPWLDGISIVSEGERFKPIAGMVLVSELLAKAWLEARNLYSGWEVVSLARLGSDRKIEVRAKDGSYVAYFSTTDSYVRQLGKLDVVLTEHLSAHLAQRPDVKAIIDLSLPRGQGGRHDVPVSWAPRAEPAGAAAVDAAAVKPEPRAGAAAQQQQALAFPLTPLPRKS